MNLTGLTTKTCGRTFLEFDRLPSTTSYCKQNIDHLTHGTVVFAEHQYDGRGTKGRTWQDAPGQMIAMTLVLKHAQLEDLPIMPLLCGLAETLALQDLGVQSTIKWPNDTVLKGKKLSGILCESIVMGKSVDIVCGIGINVSQNAQHFIDNNLPYACSILSETGRIFALETVMVALLNRFERLYHLYKELGFSAIKPLYTTHCVTLGKQVRVIIDGTEQQAFALDVADDASLLCNIDGVLRKIHHGEASIRGLWGYV